MKKPRWTTVVVILFSASCSWLTGPDDEALSVEVEPPRLLLTNHGDRAIYYIVFDRTTLALTSWAACADPALCEGIDPDRTVAVPFEEIGGYRDDTEEVAVHWWYSKRRPDGGYEADHIRSIVVRL